MIISNNLINGKYVRCKSCYKEHPAIYVLDYEDGHEKILLGYYHLSYGNKRKFYQIPYIEGLNIATEKTKRYKAFEVRKKQVSLF